ncbi:MAG: hypothetical protein ACREIC_21700, partial [Limisphaerales bacterium]
EVGQALDASEDAARKRLTRALEKLHRFLVRRGISSTITLIAAAISTHSVQAAPAGLAKPIAVMALAKAGAAAGPTFILLKGALKIMAWSKLQTAGVGLVVIGLATVSVIQHQSRARLHADNQSLRQQVESLQTENEQLSNLVSQASRSPAVQENPSDELLRLRGEVGVLRGQSNELAQSLASAQKAQLRPGATAQRQDSSLPEDYPKTPEGATRSIFQALSQGNIEGFFTNFAEPGVPKEMYEKMFNNENVKKYLTGLEVVSVGEPTNSFVPNMWFVPYKIRLQDGTEKEMRLHIAQDPGSQKWYFKGGI